MSSYKYIDSVIQLYKVCIMRSHNDSNNTITYAIGSLTHDRTADKPREIFKSFGSIVLTKTTIRDAKLESHIKPGMKNFLWSVSFEGIIYHNSKLQLSYMIYELLSYAATENPYDLFVIPHIQKHNSDIEDDFRTGIKNAGFTVIDIDDKNIVYMKNPSLVKMEE